MLQVTRQQLNQENLGKVQDQPVILHSSNKGLVS